MSSRNKRSAESEEVHHKKKPRKDEEDDAFDEDDSGSDVDDDDLEEIDQTNVIETGRRTRGNRVDYTKVPDIQELEDDSGSETEAKGPKVKGQAATDPRTRSPERKPATVVEEGEGEDDDEEDGDDDDDDGDNGDDDDDDDDEA
ncbi:hypothetical protein H4582DRAFT_2085477 [Lactarius indigo]|nr:hypothetical protein H4582DRAFT_2085477 [Lactarius indigo]